MRLAETVKQGGLTFCHSEGGDIEIQERSEGSSIPPKVPPMSNSTVDWSLLGRLQSSHLGKSGNETRTFRSGEGDSSGCEALGQAKDPRPNYAGQRYI